MRMEGIRNTEHMSMEWWGPRQSYPHLWIAPLTVRDKKVVGGKGMGAVENLHFPRDARLSSS